MRLFWIAGHYGLMAMAARHISVLFLKALMPRFLRALGGKGVLFLKWRKV